jgi:hypothetical protein
MLTGLTSPVRYKRDVFTQFCIGGQRLSLGFEIVASLVGRMWVKAPCSCFKTGMTRFEHCEKSSPPELRVEPPNSA